MRCTLSVQKNKYTSTALDKVRCYFIPWEKSDILPSNIGIRYFSIFKRGKKEIVIECDHSKE